MSRQAARRRRWPWLGLGLVSLLVSGAILRDLASMEIWRSSLRMAPPAPVSRPAGGVRPVRLFLPTEAGTLREVEQEIPRGSPVGEEISMVLHELGDEDGGVSALSAAEAHHVFLDAFGILYVDVGSGFEQVLAGPEPSEPAIRAIVSTLTANFEQVKRVQLLVGGHELASTAGSLDLRRPLTPPEPSAPAPLAQPEGSGLRAVQAPGEP